jgi:metal-responsive CopG/Arc/MetJ family transcriptional regulator
MKPAKKSHEIYIGVYFPAAIAAALDRAAAAREMDRSKIIRLLVKDWLQSHSSKN